MANPLRNLLQKKALTRLPAHARRVLTGLARDFWKDGSERPFKGARIVKPKTSRKSPSFSPASGISDAVASPGWHAMPGEVSEKMWGEGFVLPGGEAMMDMLLQPLAIDKQMNVLDISAGLGAFLHKITEKFGAHVTSLEVDPGIAIRANGMLANAGKSKTGTIAYYTPESFVPAKTVTRLYDCVLARETIYRLEDKPKFLTALAACTKHQAHVSFTDYVVNPEDRDKPAIAAWMAYEGDARPLSLVEMAEAWAKVGFKLRIHDDQTSFYRKEVLAGLQRFAKFLATGVKPDLETREVILRRTELWTHRLAAMEQGLKFYHFCGTK